MSMLAASEELKIQVRIPVGNTMYEGEQVIQEARLFLHFFLGPTHITCILPAFMSLYQWTVNTTLR